jgi:signal transduction histidine kinase/DNA-binding response OmpR family regulator
MLEQKNVQLSETREQIRKQKERIEEQYVRLKALDEAKSRFFANISHEFRTPITLIRGPLEDILHSDEAHKLTDETCYSLRMSLRNLKQLNSLIDQLLDLSKLKAGKLKLRASQQNIVPFLKRVVNTFGSAIPRHKNINIELHCRHDEVWLYFDVEKIEQVLNNLISNAIKSIEKEGRIVVELADVAGGNADESADGSFAGISVTDNGKGINASDLSLIFDRFFRADDHGLQHEQGTGIGLELCRELIELHGGSIRAESEAGKGSTFTFLLPFGNIHLQDDEIVERPTQRTNAENLQIEPLSDNDPYGNKTSGQAEAFCILIVEDNPDMRHYICKHMMNEYYVITASNGKEALSEIAKRKPDLIVSDLMMPVMDGLRLLQKVRESTNTNDIPFVMLTAKAGDEDRLTGYEMKADAYITKPFQVNELTVRIRNLLENRRHLREKYAKRVLTVTLENRNLTSADQQFLKKTKKLVIDHFSEPGFGVQRLADSMFLSERQFRRKLTELTGLSPVEFIRQVRLLQAKALIESKAFDSIAETSAAVGFNNPAYFSRLFKKIYGQSPGDLIDNL